MSAVFKSPDALRCVSGLHRSSGGSASKEEGGGSRRPLESHAGAEPTSAHDAELDESAGAQGKAAGDEAGETSATSVLESPLGGESGSGSDEDYDESSGDDNDNIRQSTGGIGAALFSTAELLSLKVLYAIMDTNGDESIDADELFM